MNEDLDRLERELRDRAAQVPYLQEAPRTMLARARHRLARNALASFAAVGLIVVGASAGLGALRSSGVGPASHAPTHSPAPAPSTTSCRAADLRAKAALGGAAGSVIGTIDLTNDGATTCTLTGRPTVTLSASSGQGLSVQVVNAVAQWQADAKPTPAGWPVVSLHPGSTAAIRVRWSNACPQLSNPASWRVELGDGGGTLDVSGADTTYPPPCNGSAEPSTLEVGPFEPGAGA
jgi:Protein of unknown function (DUF4232)